MKRVFSCCSILLLMLLSVSAALAVAISPTLSDVRKMDQILISKRPASPEDIPGSTTIEAEQAKNLFNQHIIFVDVRSKEDWASGHVPGAFNLPLQTDFTSNNLKKIIPNLATPFIIYCNGTKCWSSGAAVSLAVSFGYKKVYYYREGFPAWLEEEYPTE